MRYMKASLLALSLLLILYLAAVGLWANAAIGELLAQTHALGQVAHIHPRHVRVLLKVEDPTFYEHRGLDISKGQGLTTLTSVVARDLFLGKQRMDGVKGAAQSFYRGVFACCKRIDLGRDVMALVLHSRASKKQQLLIYLNSTYFGHLHGKAVIGFDAAAQAFHGKPLARLTDEEFYALMAMPIAPNHYHPARNPQRHAERARRIEALATGACEASGWLDLTYEGCAKGPRP